MPPRANLAALLQAPASRRQVWLLIALWALLVIGSLGLSVQRIQRQSHALLQEGARNVFLTMEAARNWNAASGGVYVPVSADNPPNPHLHSPQRDLKTREGLALTQINPAYMTRQIAREAARQGELSVHMTALRVLRPDNAADAWERQSLQALENGADEIAEVVEIAGGKKLFRYMGPLSHQSSCMTCHKHQGYQIGEIHGGISISQPYPGSQIRNQILHSAALHAVVFLLLACGSLLGLRALHRRRAQTEQAMSSLMHTEKMASMGRLVTGFAHELNTPLGVGISALSRNEECLDEFETMLQRDEVSAQEVARVLADMRESSKLAQTGLSRAANLVAGFKRSSSDIELENSRTFALRELIEDVLLTLRNVYKNTAQIELDCPAELRMNSVPGLLDQIFSNLITNSIAHAFGPERRDGQIRICVESDGADHVLISFADNGQGMDAAVMQRIFEPFFSTCLSNAHQGLGLYICYSLITERLGGSIRCDSLPGGGTHFLIRLPRQSPTQPASEAT